MFSVLFKVRDIHPILIRIITKVDLTNSDPPPPPIASEAIMTHQPAVVVNVSQISVLFFFLYTQ